MNAVTLTDLAPILVAVLGPMLAVAVTIMRYQHVDSTKTRDLIDKNRELIDKNRELNEQAHKTTRELIDKNHRELSSILGDARERVARIEGHLGIPPPPSRDMDDGDAQAA